MILVFCQTCGTGLGTKEGGDGISHGLCGWCAAVQEAEADVDDWGIAIGGPPVTITTQMFARAYRWRATANVLKQVGWTFPAGTFIGEE